jgi:lipoprotein-releasing system permease protein
MEKMMMFLILVLIIAVAAFNMLSSLVMMVTDKQADIAILRTIGLSSRQIIGIFMVQGMLTGFFGILLGLIGGILLSLNITSIVNELQNLLHVQFLNANVYYISFLPSELKWSDVIEVCVVAMLMSLLSTIYPAWRASKIKPAEALRYE